MAWLTVKCDLFHQKKFWLASPRFPSKFPEHIKSFLFSCIFWKLFCKEFWDNRETINMILKTKTKMWRLDVCLFIHYLTTIYDMWYVFDLGLQEGLIKSRGINWLENNLYTTDITLKRYSLYFLFYELCFSYKYNGVINYFIYAQKARFKTTCPM